MDKFLFLLKSRKFWAAVIGLVFVLLKAFKPDLPLDETMVTDAVTLLAAYIIGTAIDDRSKPVG